MMFTMEEYSGKIIKTGCIGIDYYNQLVLEAFDWSNALISSSLKEYSGRLIETGDAGIDYCNQLVLEAFDCATPVETLNALGKHSLEYRTAIFMPVIALKKPATAETSTKEKIIYNCGEYVFETIIKNNERRYNLYDSQLKFIASSSDIFELFSSIKTD